MVTYAVPMGLQNVEPFPFEISPLALAAFDTVAVGENVAEREAFCKNFADTSITVVKFGLNFLPFISDGADLLGQLYNTAVGKEVDPILATGASAGLILDLTTGGVGDITAPIKGAYKFSKEAADKGLAARARWRRLSGTRLEMLLQPAKVLERSWASGDIRA